MAGDLPLNTAGLLRAGSDLHMETANILGAEFHGRNMMQYVPPKKNSATISHHEVQNACFNLELKLRSDVSAGV